MDDPRRPFFRFYPGAYLPGGAFESSQEPCDVCGVACDWRYTGLIYAQDHPNVVCAACIASGRLREKTSARFSLHDSELDGAAPELEAELLQRTPGIACFNPFAWPVLDGVPLAFIGHGDDDDLQGDLAAKAAVAAAGEDCGADDIKMPTPYALVFKEVDGARYAAVIDYD